MMTKSILVFLSLMTITISAQARHDREEMEANGGICVVTRCLTLAEAGLKIYYNPGTSVGLPPNPAVTKDVLDELRNVSSFVGSYASLDNGLVYSDEDAIETFIRTDVADPGLLNRVTKIYGAILSDYHFSSEGFKLFALSTRSTTFLLPAYYRLSLRSKALVLYHEKLMRGYFAGRTSPETDKAALIEILAFDSGVVGLYKGDRRGLPAIAKAMSDFGGDKTPERQLTIAAGAAIGLTGLRLGPTRDNAVSYIRLSDELASEFRYSHTGPKGGTLNSYDNIHFWQLLHMQQPALFQALWNPAVDSIEMANPRKTGEKSDRSLDRTIAHLEFSMCAGQVGIFMRAALPDELDILHCGATSATEDSIYINGSDYELNRI